MTRLELQLSDRLAQKLARRLQGRKDPSVFICEVLERSFAQDETPQTQTPTTTLTLRFSQDEMRRIEEERLRVDMGRGEWVRASVRARLSPGRQLGQRDRTVLRRVVDELKVVTRQVRRLRWAVDGPGGAADPTAVQQAVARLEETVRLVGEAVRQSLLGNDAYWSRLADPATGDETSLPDGHMSDPRLEALIPPVRPRKP